MSARNLIVWGIPAGQTDALHETLLAETCRNESDVVKVMRAASRDGWHTFRVAVYNGEAPDFAKAVRV
jgi:hypothetical protein